MPKESSTPEVAPSPTDRLRPAGAADPAGPAVVSAAPAEWLQPAMAVNGIGSFSWEIRTNHLDWDALAARILGIGPAELGGSPERLLELVHPEDVLIVRERVGRAVRERGECGAYVRITAPGSAPRAVRFRARVVADPVDGRPHRMIGFLWEAGAEQRKRHLEDRRAAVRRARSAFLQETSRALTEATTVRDVSRVFTSLRLPGSPADGLVLGLLDAGRLTVLGISGYREEPVRMFSGTGMESPHPAVAALQDRVPVFLSDSEEYRRRFPDAWPYAASLGRRAWAFLPMTVGDRAVAVGMLSYDEEHDFAEEERTLLGTLGGLVAQALGRARLHDAEHELVTGLQQMLLPRRVPRVRGLRTAVRYLPAGSGLQIGGDWYDVVPVPGGRAALVVGDVQGHDVHAAGVMGQLRVALRAYAAEGHPPTSVLSRAGRFLADLDTGLFATCLYAEVDTSRRTIDVVRAGHPDPLVRHSDGSTTVRAVRGGLPLGIDPDESYPLTRIDLDPGEVLLLASDGLVESRTADLDAGLRHVRQVLAAPIEPICGPEPGGVVGQDAGADGAAGDEAGSTGRAQCPELEALAGRLVADAADETGREDDIALLLMRWDAEEDEAAPRVLHRTVEQADLARISEVRADLREALRRWGAPELTDIAELLVSELVTNALVHTDGDTVLTLRLFRAGPRRRLRVEVEDESDQWLRRRTPGEQASSGRGLLLVEQLADTWGVEPRGAGKRVWFTLGTEEPGGPAEGASAEGAALAEGAQDAGGAGPPES